ncbi:MAG: hypothetical protein FWD83_06290 [Promicromonosporaceae bacterium]|nr:hypothetical protein [Promicromonosporaceae bacterium]
MPNDLLVIGRTGPNTSVVVLALPRAMIYPLPAEESLVTGDSTVTPEHVGDALWAGTVRLSC